MDPIDIDICVRVKELRSKLNMTQTEFGKKIEVAQSYLTNIETAKRPVTDKIFKIICLESWNGRYVNENWLRTGEGEMFIELPENDEVAEIVSDLLEEENPFYNLILDVMRTFKQLDTNSQKAICHASAQLKENLAKKKEG